MTKPAAQKPGRPRELRLNSNLSASIRRVVKGATKRYGTTRAGIDDLLGDVRPRWTDNTLNQQDRIIASRALRILDVLAAKYHDIDAQTLAQIVREHVGGRVHPIPLLLPKQSVAALREGFATYAASHGWHDASLWADRVADFLESTRAKAAFDLRIVLLRELATSTWTINDRPVDLETFEEIYWPFIAGVTEVLEK